MSIESEIKRLADAKSDLAAAIEEYGVSVADNATLDEYGDLVRTISIPTELPNPNTLTFTGAVSAVYDGSEAVTVDIPTGSDNVPSGAVLLWSGTKAAGKNAVFNIAVDGGETGCSRLGNLSDYKLFVFIVAGNIPYLMSKADDASGLTGGLLMYSSSESSLMVRGLRADVSGNTFTVTAHKTFKTSDKTNSDSTSNLNAIYGIPLKEA